MSCEGCPSQGKCGKNSETCGIQSNPDNHIKNIITGIEGKRYESVCIFSCFLRNLY